MEIGIFEGVDAICRVDVDCSVEVFLGGKGHGLGEVFGIETAGHPYAPRHRAHHPEGLSLIKSAKEAHEEKIRLTRTHLPIFETGCGRVLRASGVGFQ